MQHCSGSGSTGCTGEEQTHLAVGCIPSSQLTPGINPLKAAEAICLPSGDPEPGLLPPQYPDTRTKTLSGVMLSGPSPSLTAPVPAHVTHRMSSHRSGLPEEPLGSLLALFDVGLLRHHVVGKLSSAAGPHSSYLSPFIQRLKQDPV